MDVHCLIADLSRNKLHSAKLFVLPLIMFEPRAAPELAWQLVGVSAWRKGCGALGERPRLYEQVTCFTLYGVLCTL